MLYTEKMPKQGFLRSMDLTLFASTWGSRGARGPFLMTFFFAMTPVGFIRTQRKFFWLFLKCYWALLNSIWIFLPAPVIGRSQIWVCSFNCISCSAAQIFKFQSFLLQKLLTVAILYIPVKPHDWCKFMMHLPNRDTKFCSCDKTKVCRIRNTTRVCPEP